MRKPPKIRLKHLHTVLSQTSPFPRTPQTNLNSRHQSRPTSPTDADTHLPHSSPNRGHPPPPVAWHPANCPILPRTPCPPPPHAKTKSQRSTFIRRWSPWGAHGGDRSISASRTTSNDDGHTWFNGMLSAAVGTLNSGAVSNPLPPGVDGYAHLVEHGARDANNGSHSTTAPYKRSTTHHHAPPKPPLWRDRR